MGEPVAVKRYSLRINSNPSLAVIRSLVLHSARLDKLDFILFRRLLRFNRR